MKTNETPLNKCTLTRCPYLVLASIAVCLFISSIFVLHKDTLNRLMAPVMQHRIITARVPGIRVRLRMKSNLRANIPCIVSILDPRGVESLRFPFTNVAISPTLGPQDEVLLDSYSAQYGFTDSKLFGIIPLEDSPKPWRKFVVSISQEQEVVAVIPCEEIFAQAELIGRPTSITTTVIHINDTGRVTTDNFVQARVQEIVCTIVLNPPSKPQDTIQCVSAFHFQTPDDQ